MRYLIAAQIILMAITLPAFGSQGIRPRPGAVALTFDDGPDPKYTRGVLDILAKYQVKATFFLVGYRAKARPDLVRAIKNAGHTIGNHSYKHPRLTRLSSAAIQNELLGTNQLLKDIIGEAPKCMRPPYAKVNKRVREVAAKIGLQVAVWDLDSRDYTGETPDVETAEVLGHAKAGAVILMHDSLRGGSRTVLALPKIIEGYKRDHVGFDTICD